MAEKKNIWVLITIALMLLAFIGYFGYLFYVIGGIVGIVCYILMYAVLVWARIEQKKKWE